MAGIIISARLRLEENHFPDFIQSALEKRWNDYIERNFTSNVTLLPYKHSIILSANILV